MPDLVQVFSRLEKAVPWVDDDNNEWETETHDGWDTSSVIDYHMGR